MGIHPYGLFGTNESNNPFGPDYELKRQLAARQAQLSELSNKTTLTPDDEKRKEQLNNAVNQLSSKLNKEPSTTDTATVTTSDNSNEIINRSSQIKSANIKTYAEGSVMSKGASPAIYRNVQATQNSSAPQNDYLKGFFLDLKI